MGLNKNILYNDVIKVHIDDANNEDLYIFGPLKTYLLLFRNNFFKFRIRNNFNIIFFKIS